MVATARFFFPHHTMSRGKVKATSSVTMAREFSSPYTASGCGTYRIERARGGGQGQHDQGGWHRADILRTSLRHVGRGDHHGHAIIGAFTFFLNRLPVAKRLGTLENTLRGPQRANSHSSHGSE